MREIPVFASPPTFGYNGLALSMSLSLLQQNINYVSEKKSKPATTSLGMSDGKEKLNEIDLMCITNAAIFCAEEEDECDLDQVESIVNQLNDQSEILQEELTTLEDLDKNLSKFKGVHPIPTESNKR